MLSLKTTQRTVTGRKTGALRKEGQVPAVLYGPGSLPVSLAVQKKEFDAVYRDAGESSLVTL